MTCLPASLTTAEPDALTGWLAVTVTGVPTAFAEATARANKPVGTTSMAARAIVPPKVRFIMSTSNGRRDTWLGDLSVS